MEELVSVNREWCKGCGICAAFCPKRTLELNREGKAFQARPEDCVHCGMCALYCPDLAVETHFPDPAKQNKEARA